MKHSESQKGKKMFGFIIGFLLGIYFWRCWTWPRTRPVKPGLNKDIILPHTESLELHHNMLSSCSQKVRACLGETGLKHKKIHHVLPSSGSWETKCADYLNNVNPAGTVPVLIHKGHPIYESHEQIVYIDKVLLKDDNRLTPEDPSKIELMEKWVQSGSLISSEMNESGFSKRIGNLLFPMTLPLFAANIHTNFTIWNMLETLSMIPLSYDSRKIIMQFNFKIFGVQGFQKMKPFKNLVESARKGIAHHFEILSKDLEQSGGPFICGSQFTLADISMIPIFERMTYARWWTDTLKKKYPIVFNYWESIQMRDGYKASKPDQEMHEKMTKVGKVIDQWKLEHKWFNDFYL